MIGSIAERLREKADSGEIGFLGINDVRSTIRVAPTYLIVDPEKLDEFSEGLLTDLKPTYRLNSVGSILYWVHGLAFPLLRFKETSVWVLPDYQLAENMSVWEAGVGIQYPHTSFLDGLTRGLNKKQLDDLRQNPLGFNESLRRQVEYMKKNPPNFCFIAPKNPGHQIIPGLVLI